jgi:hypothetical protein
MKKRGEALDTYDRVMKTLNAAQGPHKPPIIKPITYKDFDGAVSDLDEMAAQLLRTPNTTAENAGPILKALGDVKKDIMGFAGSAESQFTRGTIHGSKAPAPRAGSTTGQLTPKDLNLIISNVYKKARSLDAFTFPDDPIAQEAADATAQTLKQVVFRLREMRDGKIQEIYNAATKGGKSVAGLDELGPDAVKNLNDGVHHLLNIQEAGTRPFLEAVVPRPGARAAFSDMTDEIGKPTFNKQSMFGVAMEKMKKPFGYGRDTLEQRLDSGAMSNINDVAQRRMSQAGMFERAANRMDSPFGVAAGEAFDAMNDTPDAAVAQSLSQHALEHGIERKQEGGEIKIPRSTAGLNQFTSQLLDKIAVELGDPGMMEQLRGTFSHGTDREKKQAIALLLKHVPETAAFFEPSKSGLLSEIDGEIYDKDDLAAAADALERSDMTDREKAKAWKILWEEKRYTGKPLASKSQLPQPFDPSTPQPIMFPPGY